MSHLSAIISVHDTDPELHRAGRPAHERDARAVGGPLRCDYRFSRILAQLRLLVCVEVKDVDFRLTTYYGIPTQDRPAGEHDLIADRRPVRVSFNCIGGVGDVGTLPRPE